MRLEIFERDLDLGIMMSTEHLAIIVELSSGRFNILMGYQVDCVTLLMPLILDLEVACHGD